MSLMSGSWLLIRLPISGSIIDRSSDAICTISVGFIGWDIRCTGKPALALSGSSITESSLVSDDCRVFFISCDTPWASSGEEASRLSPLLNGVLFSAVSDLHGVILVALILYQWRYVTFAVQYTFEIYQRRFTSL